MKKFKKMHKLVLMSSLAAILTGGVAISSTYALFTSETKVSVTVTSGKVKITSTIDDFETSSGIDVTGYPTSDKISTTTTKGTFTNGGTAKIDSATNSLILDKMTPGDKVSFKIKITNESDVKIKYRTKIMCSEDGGLFNGLKVTVDGNSYEGVTTISNYQELEVNNNPKEISVTIELPTDATNDYQGKSCTIANIVEAVQGNAATSDPEVGVFEIYTPSDLRFFQKHASEFKKDSKYPDVVKLKNDIDLANSEWTPINWDNRDGTATFDGCGFKISNFVVNGEKDLGLFGNIVGIHINNLTVDNATINGIGRVGAIAGQGLCDYFYNCHVTNSKITATPAWNGKEFDDGDKAGGIIGQLSAQNSASLTNSSVEGCTIKAYRDLGALAGHVQNSPAIVENNTVSDSTVIQDYSILTEEKNTVGKIVGRQDGAIDKGYSAFVLDENKNTAFDIKMLVSKIDGIAWDSNKRIFEIYSGNGLQEFAKIPSSYAGLDYQSCSVELTDDIHLTGYFTPITWNKGTWTFTFNGNGHTIYGLKVNQTGIATEGGRAGLFDYAAGGTIENLIIDGAVVNGTYHTGAIVGCGEPVTIKNCILKNSIVHSNIDSKGDGANKVGAIVGYIQDAGGEVSGCQVINTEVKGYRQVGGLVGYTNGSTISNNTLTDVTIINDLTTDYEKYATKSSDAYAQDNPYKTGYIVGEYYNTTISNNDYSKNVTIKVKKTN